MVVGDFLRRTAARYPEKTGVVFEKYRFTWREVNLRVNRLANALVNLGLDRQDRIGILCRNSHQYLEIYFASAKAGLIGVPLNTRFLGSELTYQLNDSGAKALFVDSEFTDTARDISTGLPDISLYIGIGEEHPFELDYETLIRETSDSEPQMDVREDDIYVLAYTSGTTGRPKGAIITHKNSVTAGLSYAIEVRILPDDVFLSVGPFYFGAAAGQRFPAVIRGATLVITSFEAQEVFRLIEEEKVTIFHVNPVTLKILIDHPDRHRYNLRSIRYIGITAAPLSIELLKAAERVFGNVFFHQYGLTETGPIGTVLQKEEVAAEGKLSSRMGSIGVPYVNIDVMVVDDNGKEVSRNKMETGEIILRGDSVTKGYWNDPEKTAETIRDGWFYSGDLAVVDEDGYIFIVDRKKDMIVSGGINIYPREIEDVLHSHPAVLHAAVIGVPHEKWGETPKALIVLKEHKTCTESEIIDFCKKSLASYKKPSSIVFVEKLPMTATGKILKREIRENYSLKPCQISLP